HGVQPDPGVAAGPRGSRLGYFIVRIAQRRDALVGAAQDRCLPGPAGLADVHSAAAAGLRGAVRRGAVAGGGCAAVVRVGLAAEGAADEHSGSGRYCGVSGDAGGQWHAHEACAQVARGAANQVTSCSAPALRAWEGRALARPQSRGAELPAAPFRTEGGAPTWGMARVYGVQLGAKAYPMTPPLLTLYTWRL